ncbi:MAG: hypothetical protein EBE86_008730 [Hormoscilla sp. GUM202]|nr:hypothetical protein [Hormoscilla sp. GUM202]
MSENVGAIGHVCSKHFSACSDRLVGGYCYYTQGEADRSGASQICKEEGGATGILAQIMT